MTVAELIKALSELDHNLSVVYESSAWIDETVISAIEVDYSYLT